MSNIPCILCNSTEAVAIEALNTQLLSTLYKKRANINVNHYFTQKEIRLCQCNNCHLLFYSPIILGDGKFYEDLQSYEGYYLETVLKLKQKLL